MIYDRNTKNKKIKNHDANLKAVIIKNSSESILQLCFSQCNRTATVVRNRGFYTITILLVKHYTTIKS